MHIPTSFPFVFEVSPHPRPRRSAQVSASLVNLGTCTQALQIPIPYCVRTYYPMGVSRGPALPLIRQRVRSFRQHLFFFRLFNECPRLRPRLATNTSATLSKPEHPQVRGVQESSLSCMTEPQVLGSERAKHPRCSYPNVAKFEELCIVIWLRQACRQPLPNQIPFTIISLENSVLSTKKHSRHNRKCFLISFAI